jgi:iron complex transport system substrate-binding protein
MHTFLRSLLVPLTVLFLSSCSTQLKTDQDGAPLKSPVAAPCRMVEHGQGQTCVPLNPKRVVVLGELDNVLALGVQPVGAATFDNGRFPVYLRERIEGVEAVGTYSQPSLEKILLLKPDLILGTTWDEATLYEQLSQIAPTVFVRTHDNRDWKAWLRKQAEALGNPKAAEQLISRYEQRVEAFKQAMGDRLNLEVSVVNFWQDQVRIYMNQSFSGLILAEAGLARPPIQNQEKLWEPVSLELIPKMEGDVIFLMLGDHNQSKLKQFQEHPLWSRLKPVQEKKVYEVDSLVWIGGWGITAANRVLDDLNQFLMPMPKAQHEINYTGDRPDSKPLDERLHQVSLRRVQEEVISRKQLVGERSGGVTSPSH